MHLLLYPYVLEKKKIAYTLIIVQNYREYVTNCKKTSSTTTMEVIALTNDGS